MMNFLTARWSNLLLLNYAVPPRVVAEMVRGTGLEPDLRGGSAFVSLVAFNFLETRVLGVGWPGFRDFPEVNLRAYVRSGDRRGVVFARELVPSPFVAWVARTLYNEPYQAVPMRSSVARERGRVIVEHRQHFPHGATRIAAIAQDDPQTPASDTDAHWFKEHAWGFGRSRGGRLLRYEVAHPVWRVFPVLKWHLEWDWAAVYGRRWSFLQDATPQSVVLAEGSRIEVKWHAPNT